MSLKNESIEKKLQILQQEYLASLPDKIGQIQTQWEKLSTQNWDPKLTETVCRNAHSLAGSGTTFGFAAISQSARELEHALQKLIGQINTPSNDTIKKVNNLLEILVKHHQEIRINNTNSITQHTNEPTTDNSDNQYNTQHTILYLYDKIQNNETLSSQIEQFNYHVIYRGIHEILPGSKLLQDLSGSPPTAIVADLEEMQQSQPEWLNHIQLCYDHPIPIVFICQSGKISSRLSAVRSGGFAYFTWPPDISTLIDALDNVSNLETNDPYRVLIVDDSAELAEAYSLYLHEAGMITEVVTEPLETLSRIIQFGPELILMDMYMPDCSGPELASVIRQQGAYASIPIVFLSAEENVNKQLDALSLGGDDFLTKPILPNHLITAVKIRAERYRDLRSYMVRDSLTGLLNHTKIDEQLQIEIARAHREKQQLSYVMIDIDHFKTVNDTYGHACGDRVIKSLARLLQQTLRKTDIIGRYGGEEFAVILSNTDADTAKDVMDKIREKFNSLQQLADDRTFSCSFSCGIAGYPQFASGPALNSNADAALYQAKNAGRNQVKLAISVKVSAQNL